MAVLVDTSAILALLNRDDPGHAAVTAAWERLTTGDEDLITRTYALVETCALAASRLGMAAVRDIAEVVAPLLTIEWVDSALHQAAMSAVLTANRRRLSLVDCVSFAIMRRGGLSAALTVDAHFVEPGFVCLP